MSAPRPGSLASRVLRDGMELTLYPMIPGQVRLCYGEAGAPVFDRAWCFHDAEAAMRVVETWDGGSDKPPGPWYRDLQTGERRELDAEGNVIREWVAR